MHVFYFILFLFTPCLSPAGPGKPFTPGAPDGPLVPMSPRGPLGPAGPREPGFPRKQETVASHHKAFAGFCLSRFLVRAERLLTVFARNPIFPLLPPRAFNKSRWATQLRSKDLCIKQIHCVIFISQLLY